LKEEWFKFLEGSEEIEPALKDVKKPKVLLVSKRQQRGITNGSY